MRLKSHCLGMFCIVTTFTGAVQGQSDFEALEDAFREKLVVLSADTNLPPDRIRAEISVAALETFGKQPEVMRAECLRRFSLLPSFSAERLASYVDYQTRDDFPMPQGDNGAAWLMLGFAPQKLAEVVKMHTLSRVFGRDDFSRHSLLNSVSADRLYRLGDGENTSLVVDCLGDLFVIRLEIMDSGVFVPKFVKWMKPQQAGQSVASPESEAVPLP